MSALYSMRIKSVWWRRTSFSRPDDARVDFDESGVSLTGTRMLLVKSHIERDGSGYVTLRRVSLATVSQARVADISD